MLGATGADCAGDVGGEIDVEGEVEGEVEVVGEGDVEVSPAGAAPEGDGEGPVGPVGPVGPLAGAVTVEPAPVVEESAKATTTQPEAAPPPTKATASARRRIRLGARPLDFSHRRRAAGTRPSPFIEFRV